MDQQSCSGEDSKSRTRAMFSDTLMNKGSPFFPSIQDGNLKQPTDLGPAPAFSPVKAARLGYLSRVPVNTFIVSSQRGTLTPDHKIQ